MFDLTDPPLPFPTSVMTRDGKGCPTSEEYLIPIHAKKEILESMYPFEGVPDLADTRYDIHEGKKFVVGEFKVVRENGTNYLVSPYYYASGGTVIDWMPADFAQRGQERA
jgi:hypothetical protein